MKENDVKILLILLSTSETWRSEKKRQKSEDVKLEVKTSYPFINDVELNIAVDNKFDIIFAQQKVSDKEMLDFLVDGNFVFPTSFIKQEIPYLSEDKVQKIVNELKENNKLQIENVFLNISAEAKKQSEEATRQAEDTEKFLRSEKLKRKIERQKSFAIPIWFAFYFSFGLFSKFVFIDEISSSTSLSRDLHEITVGILFVSAIVLSTLFTSIWYHFSINKIKNDESAK
jgi:hypothetical protein